MQISFIKMHGAGNDYIYVDCFKNEVEKPAETAIQISDRHFGVGADGLVLILPSEIADCKMRIFNADGSEAQMCGNAIRCVGKYLYETGIVPHCHCGLDQQSNVLQVETLSGIKTLKIVVSPSLSRCAPSEIKTQTIENKVECVEVAMGKADFTAKNVPILVKSDTYINMPLDIDGEKYNITAVSTGNPHCVVFCENIDEIPIEIVGKKFEHHAFFSERVNTEFVQIIDKQTVKMRVWERGSGETMACGTGACASVAAAVKNSLLDFDTEICVKVLGGELFITCKNNFEMIMKGNAVEVFRGTFCTSAK
ncbi:MAG: diaminopimelate epimerase [Prevotellaceae bacterium]|jgi:diaminopimelate epimerase|nr:diaminopimelate epimerase [Prevotellaceae bacterium]